MATAPGNSREGAWSPVWAVHTAARFGSRETWATTLHGFGGFLLFIFFFSNLEVGGFGL